MRLDVRMRQAGSGYQCLPNEDLNALFCSDITPSSVALYLAMLIHADPRWPGFHGSAALIGASYTDLQEMIGASGASKAAVFNALRSLYEVGLIEVLGPVRGGGIGYLVRRRSPLGVTNGARGYQRIRRWEDRTSLSFSEALAEATTEIESAGQPSPVRSTSRSGSQNRPPLNLSNKQESPPQPPRRSLTVTEQDFLQEHHETILAAVERLFGSRSTRAAEAVAAGFIRRDIPIGALTPGIEKVLHRASTERIRSPIPYLIRCAEDACLSGQHLTADDPPPSAICGLLEGCLSDGLDDLRAVEKVSKHYPTYPRSVVSSWVRGVYGTRPKTSASTPPPTPLTAEDRDHAADVFARFRAPALAAMVHGKDRGETRTDREDLLTSAL